MRIKDLMSRGIVTCEPDSPLHEVATRMKEHDVGFLPVVDNEKVVAIVTDRDLVTRALAAERGPDTAVRDVATPRKWTVEESDSIDNLANRMKDKRVRRFIVIDGEKRPVGVVTLGDLAHHGDADAAGEVLEAISAPAKPMRVDERTEALPAFARVVE